MTHGGTRRYDQLRAGAVPALVLEAVARARRLDFPLCVHPVTGRLLAAVAGGFSVLLGRRRPQASGGSPQPGS